MKKIAVTLPLVLALALPLVASAHEHATYQIGKNYYQIVIGSLNEPIAVDDKSGVDLTITKCFTAACTPTKGPDGDMDGPSGTPVSGLESTLKVELSAGGVKKMLSIAPVYGKEGSYSAPFYPTVATTFSYRVNGTIHDVPVDLSFACLPESSAAPAAETTPKKISDQVTQLSHGGKFGCPKPKEGLGFPEPAPALVSLKDDAERSGNALPIGLGAAALALAAASFIKRK